MKVLLEASERNRRSRSSREGLIKRERRNKEQFTEAEGEGRDWLPRGQAEADSLRLRDRRCDSDVPSHMEPRRETLSLARLSKSVPVMSFSTCTESEHYSAVLSACGILASCNFAVEGISYLAP
jgi:hypothetical protein